MRLLLFADLHLDAPFAWAPRQVARARRLALREALVRVCALAASQRVDALCCAGDLYEQGRYTPDTAAFLRATFAGIHPIPVLLAPGNHDWLGPESLYRQVQWSDNVRLFAEPRLVPMTLADGLTLWGAAHCAPANTPGFLDGFRVDRGGIHIGLFHGSEQGELAFQESGKVPHAPFRADQIPRAGLHHAMVGHFHTPRYGVNHTYPGNPEPLAFGETGERGAVSITIDGSGSVTRERHSVAVSRVGDVDVDITGAASGAEVRDRVGRALADVKGTVRVTLFGEVAPEVEIDLAGIAEAAPHLDAVVPRLGHVDVAYDFEVLAEEHTVRGQFVRDVRAAATLSDEERRKVMITGLRALDGRRGDLEVH